MSTPESLLQRARAAALQAGDFLLHERPETLAVESKSSLTDAVTAMDRGSERLIVERLLAESPTDSVLGEETGETTGSSATRWIIDPLDGTVNYLYGVPEWAVSIAAEHDGRVVAGVVHAPVLQQTWWAATGLGAWVDNRGQVHRLSVSSEHRLDLALVGTGFGYNADLRRWQARTITYMMDKIRDIRRAGSAAIDLCRVADGTYDAHVEARLNLWDIAAGNLMISEAGGRVVTLPSEWGEVNVSAGGVFDDFTECVRQAIAANT